MKDQNPDSGIQTDAPIAQLRAVLGVSEEHRRAASRLFWEAFSRKHRVPLGPPHKAHAFVERVLDTRHAIQVVSERGELLGVAGFKTLKGAFVDGSFQDLVTIYGALGASWRAVMLAMLERHGDDRTLLMDGIFVASHARGKGIGSILLRAIEEQAVVLQKDRVRLDVIDTNPRAKALYERFGYQADGGRRTGPLSYLFGFEAATTMYKSVVPQSTE